MKLLVLCCCLGLLAATASAESMMQAFRKFQNKKANQHRIPDNVKGVVCERSGRAPKSYCCSNKHGVRCSPDFQAETDTCPGAGCPKRRVQWCDNNYEGEVHDDDGIENKKPLRPGARCRTEIDEDDGYPYLYEVIGPCKTNGEIQQSLCPQPCGCVLDGHPKRESASVWKTQKINGECGSSKVTREIKKLLKAWKVPQSAYLNFEMGILGDSSHFTVFDLFIQPKENEARYSLAIGAARCHRKSVEIGYMYTGMWKVDTVNNYKCHWKGGCSSVGIPEESIDKARVALEWYAWKDLRVGGRRQ